MKKLIIVVLFTGLGLPAFTQDHFQMGNQQFMAGKYDEAVKEYLLASVTKDSADPELYFNIGMAKTQLLLYPEAVSYFNTAINLKPDYKLAWYQRGLAKEESGDHAGAIADYNKAIEISPQYLDARFERGYSKTNAGDFPGAIEDFDYYINQKGPHLANAYYERAAAKNRNADYEGALIDLEKATGLGLKDKYIYFETAYANEGTGNFLKAIEIYTKVIAADPSYVNAYYRRGASNLSLNNKEEACKDIRKAYEMGLLSAKADLDKVCK